MLPLQENDCQKRILPVGLANLMNPHRSSEEDRIAINAVKAAFFDLLGKENFTSGALDELAQSLRAEFASYHLYDQSMEHLLLEASSGLNIISVLEQLPASDALQFGNKIKDLSGYSWIHSDPLVEAECHETRLAPHVGLPIGVRNVIYSVLRDSSGFAHLLAVCRSETVFAERDRSMAHHLFPTFIKSHKCNRLIIERLQDIQDKPPLTKRELEVLYLIADGKTNSDIGKQLNISGRTVDKHCSNLFEKMGFENRNTATRYVLDLKAAQFYASND